MDNDMKEILKMKRNQDMANIIPVAVIHSKVYLGITKQKVKV
jgi:hypothetical protein